MKRLSGKRVVITGGASGLGAAIARRFHSEGASVVVIDLERAAGPADELVRSLRTSQGQFVVDRQAPGDPGTAGEVGVEGEHRAWFVAGDVGAAESIRRAIDEAADRMGGLDIAIASAGVSSHPESGFRGLIDLEPEHFDYVQHVNVRGVFLTAQRAAQRMIADGTAGSILVLASIASKRPSAGAYSVSKAAAWMLTRSLALELAPHRIRVNAIGPAYVPTAMLRGIARDAAGDSAEAQAEWISQKGDQLPLGELPTADDIASTALFLSSDEGRMYTGAILHPDGGLTSSTGGG